MKTLKSACKPRDTVFDAARRDTVLDLSDLVGDRIKPEEFFPENYITEGMKTLLTEGFLENELKLLTSLRAEFDAVAEQQSKRLVDAHERYSALMDRQRFQVVYPVLPMDLLGMYILLPDGGQS